MDRHPVLMPLVSAIIPAFNGQSRYLAEAIQSILNQTCRDVELIVVDDASTDRTYEIVPTHPHITYVRRETNGGQAAARNTGATLAKGEFLAFLDQDDLWEPTFLEETLPALQSDAGAACVHADGYTVNAENEIVNYEHTSHRTDSIGYCLKNGHLLDTSGSLFRKTHFDGVNGYDERLTIYEDTDLGIRLHRRHQLRHIPKPLYRHRVYGHNVSRLIQPERAFAACQYFLEKHAPACRHDTHLEKVLAAEWARLYSDMGHYHLSQNRRIQARGFFLRALRLSPWSWKTMLRYLRSWAPFATGRQKSAT